MSASVSICFLKYIIFEYQYLLNIWSLFIIVSAYSKYIELDES